MDLGKGCCLGCLSLSDSLGLCLSLRLHLGRYLSLLLGHESLVPGWVSGWQEVVGW